MSWLKSKSNVYRDHSSGKPETFISGSSARPAIVVVLILLSGHCDTALAMPRWAREVIESSRPVQRHDDASAVILYHSIEAKVSSKGHMSMKIRRIVRILSENGTRAAAVSEAVSSQRELTDLKGWHERSDGSSSTLSERDAILIKPRIVPGYYDDQQGLVASFRRAGAGSLIAFEYEIEAEEWTNPYYRIHLQWYREPVDYFSYRLKVPEGWMVEHAYHNVNNVAFSQDKQTFEWVARDLKYIPEEALMPEWTDVKPFIEFSCRPIQDEDSASSPGWEKVGIWASRLMDNSVAQDSAIDALATRLTSSSQSKTEMAQAIGRHVRDNIRYVAVEIGRGGIVPRSAPVTLQNLYGDCKDKSALTRALLACVGISSVPVLAMTKRSITPQMPSGSQFNHCILAISSEELVDIDSGYSRAMASSWLFFDPTAEQVKFGHLPGPLYGQHVLVCDPNVSELVRLPKNDDYGTTYSFAGEATLSMDGSVSANITVIHKSPGITKAFRDSQFPDDDSMRAAQQAKMREWIPTARISNFQHTVLEDSTIVQFELDAKHYAQNYDSEIIFNPLLVKPPVSRKLTKPSRQFPIRFGSSAYEEFKVVWNIPEAMIGVDLPQDIADSCAAGKVRSTVIQEDGRITILAHRSYTGQQLSSSEYEVAQVFDRNLSRFSNLSVLLSESSSQAQQ